MDVLDEYLLEEILNEKFPNNRLPSIDECLRAIKDPKNANPLINACLKRRPSFADFLRQCLEPE